MICYKKLFDLMKSQGKNTAHIRAEKIVGQETLRKLKMGTGVFEEYEYRSKDRDSEGKTITVSETKVRETSIDTKSIESLCIWLNCQPSDIMEVIPNTWDNADRLCEIFSTKDHICTRDELPKRVPMEGLCLLADGRPKDLKENKQSD